MTRFPPLVALACATVMLAGVGCKVSTSDRNIVAVEPEQAKQEMTRTKGGFGSKERVRGVYLDPRDEQAYARKHIPGAVNLPFADLDGAAQAVLGDFDVIVVYDTDYGDVIAKAASKRLLELGFKDVLTLKGGITAWERDGNRVEGTAVGSGSPPRS